MTIRKIVGGYEIKLPLVPCDLLVVTCQSRRHALQLDKIGRLHEKVVNNQPCTLGELDEALIALNATGVIASILHDRLQAKVESLRR